MLRGDWLETLAIQQKPIGDMNAEISIICAVSEMLVISANQKCSLPSDDTEIQTNLINIFT